MTQTVKYVVQTPGWLVEWMDGAIRDTLKEAQEAAKSYKSERFVRIIKRTDEELSIKENNPPKPKFKAGDLVRPEHTSRKEHPTLVGRIIGPIEGSYWKDGSRWNYNLEWNDPNFPDWNGCREYELVRTSLPF